MTSQKKLWLETSRRLTRLSGVCAGVLLSTSALADNINLSYAFFAPSQTFPAVQMEHWAKELNERTDGQVNVNTFPGGTLLTAANMFDGVLNGVADIGLSATSYEPGRFPLLNLAGNLTGIDVNSQTASQAVYELIKEFPAETLGLEEFKVITAFTSEPGYLHTQESVTSLEDLEGQEIRVPGDSTAVVQALGGVPVGLTQSETGEALQAGIVNGYVGSRETLMDLQYARNVSYITDYPLTNVVFVAVMNQQRWDALPENVQQEIDALGAEMASYAGKYLDEHIQESLTWAAENHDLEQLTLSEEEAERWSALLEPINEQRLEEVAAQGLPAFELRDRFIELIEQNQ
ncbi:MULTISPECIES: TRAP transporter substrate-binding protein [Halomonadaceae]|jgi:TRAP-type transport system periplasmic protein|uniref:TRAP transporter substrate-binding protein n=1 Tax=Vreelandella sedimenti TaxID=2729618 RepID=A0A7Z0N6P3_9GAMM|nr:MULTISPECIES: TRAP transporter substrate-binding protein [Halomonas]NYT71971.1 TRAP transporter substrate-binding protein [Halomonas sedimenti]CAD5248456.1 C4-dicarboxylate ABC transporter substrate-binding protein [Halomonas sp. 156]CAD5265107.1 C4-dicarboxylate ABC transporter substrate-binding protein [Halomonas sp. 113]CAD5267334.1 C4-dicarboxylate ABC transporter substrate-binding protein [Halomonas sp. 59]CAD5279756.1 C4-dicarboxylate ABC transporter substrate-binding protein [Halomon